MKARIILLSTITTAVLSISAVHAAAGSPVTHNHNGRSHSHPLPSTGKNHAHGNVLPKTKKAPVAHSHAGRTHKHSLPAAGKNHTHGVAKKKAAPESKSAYSIAHDRENAVLVSKGWQSLSKNWYIVATSINHLLTVKRHSAVTEGAYRTMVMQQHARSYKGDKDITVITRVVKISSADCKREMGVIRVFKLNGTQETTADYAKGGSTTIDALGEHVCGMSR